AAFDLRAAVSRMEKLASLRPQQFDDMLTMIDDEVVPVRNGIDGEARARFERAVGAMGDADNADDKANDRRYFRWKIPEMAPPDPLDQILDLGPGLHPRRPFQDDDVAAVDVMKPVAELAHEHAVAGPQGRRHRRRRDVERLEQEGLDHDPEHDHHREGGRPA